MGHNNTRACAVVGGNDSRPVLVWFVLAQCCAGIVHNAMLGRAMLLHSVVLVWADDDAQLLAGTGGRHAQLGAKNVL